MHVRTYARSDGRTIRKHNVPGPIINCMAEANNHASVNHATREKINVRNRTLMDYIYDKF